MGVCMSLFYDTSECRWEETLLAQGVLQASCDEHRLPRAAFSELSDADFREMRPLTHNTRPSVELQPGSGGRVLAWEYAPRVFRCFREAPEFCNSIRPEEWEESWRRTAQTCADRAGLGAGKSGATFLKSNDRHWIIKTIDVKEVEKQRRMLREYLLHFRENPHSLLMRHLQMLKLEEHNESGKATVTKYLLVAENVADSAEQRDERDRSDCIALNSWDLKGRQPKPGKLPQANTLYGGKLGKDKELTRVFALPPEVRRELVGSDSADGPHGPGILKRDADFLMQHNLMDYSLLIHTWPSCREEHGSNLPPKLTHDQQWLLQAAYDNEEGMCADAAEGLYLPQVQLAELELAEARMRLPRHRDPTADGDAAPTWEGSWVPEHYSAQRALLGSAGERTCSVRIGTPDRPVHKYHNGIVSAAGDEIFFIGIIDVLTEYHLFKRLANCCKKFAFFEDQLSTIPADKYERRFSRYMRDVFPSSGPPPSHAGLHTASAAQRRQGWRAGGPERGGGPGGHDQFRLAESQEHGPQWVTEAEAGGQWARLKRRNSLRWQYQCMRQKVKADVLMAQQRSAARKDFTESFGPSAAVMASG
eukprot:TRINITY_DN55513_c0_g1_i1.p1 TRINITY_DN55513_c0_g1~~TRINITY_DN55513_c0_g1_i1.p1  ORF type:complete len:590 (+),score=205.62 TRINITY_DN55513_c0_g1_i1:91-1860(+)